jgi:hypothetical protein
MIEGKMRNEIGGDTLRKGTTCCEGESCMCVEELCKLRDELKRVCEEWSESKCKLLSDVRKLEDISKGSVIDEKYKRSLLELVKGADLVCCEKSNCLCMAKLKKIVQVQDEMEKGLEHLKGDTYGFIGEFENEVGCIVFDIFNTRLKDAFTGEVSLKLGRGLGSHDTILELTKKVNSVTGRTDELERI